MSSTTKHSLLVLFRMPPTAIDLLKESFELEIPDGALATREYTLSHAAGKDAILCIPFNAIDKEVLDAAGPNLKVVSTISAGYEHIDLEECRKRKIPVGYLGSLVAEGMAEFTIGLMIATGRRFKEHSRVVEGGDWMRRGSPANNRKLGIEIKGSTVGIVGFGHIGQNLAKLLRPFQVKQILYCGPREKPEGHQLGAEHVPLSDLLKESDFVIACCSTNDETRGMFNANAFHLMKPTSIFINVARGNLVNHEDLHEALVNQRIWAAGLDTVTPEPLPHDHPLVKLENCLILPHIGTCSEPLRSEMFKTAYRNLVAGVKGQPMPFQIL